MSNKFYLTINSNTTFYPVLLSTTKPAEPESSLRMLEKLAEIDVKNVAQLERIQWAAYLVFNRYGNHWCPTMKCIFWLISCFVETRYTKSARLYQEIVNKKAATDLTAFMPSQTTSQELEMETLSFKRGLSNNFCWFWKKNQFSALFEKHAKFTLELLDLAEKKQQPLSREDQLTLRNFLVDQGVLHLYTLARSSVHFDGDSWVIKTESSVTEDQTKKYNEILLRAKSLIEPQNYGPLENLMTDQNHKCYPFICLGLTPPLTS